MSTITTDQRLVLPVDGDLGDVTTAMANYNGGVENRLVKRYESAVDRSVRNPAPNKGEISYLADTDVHERFDGANWQNLRGGADHFFLPGETGTVNMSFTNQSSSFVTVAFTTPFTSSPVVLTNISSGTGAAASWGSRAYQISPTGFSLLVYQPTGTNSTWSSIPVDWVAIGRQ